MREPIGRLFPIMTALVLAAFPPLAVAGNVTVSLPAPDGFALMAAGVVAAAMFIKARRK